MREAGTSPWVDDVLRPLVMAVMVGCIAWSVVELVRAVAPAWNGTFLVVGCVLVALEANYSHRLLKTRWELRFSAMQFRLAEMVVILVALKVGSYVGDGWASVLAEIKNWPYEPGKIFDPETLLACALALIAWLTVNQTIDDLELLAEPPETYARDIFPMENLFQRFLAGGVILLITAGFSRVAPAETLKLDRPSTPGLVLNALIYFLMGLVMLGQVQLARLRVQWQAQEIKVADGLASRWARYSLTFIGLAALAALVLPTGYTSGMLLIAGLAIGLAFSALGAIAWLLVALLLLPLFYVLSKLTRQGEPTPEASLPPSAPMTLPQAAETAATPEWFMILRMLIFWAIVLGVLFYLFHRYLRDHPELQKSLVALRPVRALRRGWAALWRWLKSWSARLGQTVGERLPRRLSRRLRRAAPGVALPFFRLGGLSPRE